MDEYMVQFIDESEGSSRAAVKRLRNKIYSDLIEGTINSPDWYVILRNSLSYPKFLTCQGYPLCGANGSGSSLGRRGICSAGRLCVHIANVSCDTRRWSCHSCVFRLVDVFATPDVTPNVMHVRRQLLVYYSLLQSTGLTNSVLCDLPLPATLDPSKRTPLTLRLRTLFALIPDTLACMIYLPFFFFPLIVHLPVYILARIGAKLVIDEEETLAQNKVVLGLLAMFLVYPTAFFVLWALFLFSPIGALLAWGTLYVFAMYHNRLVDRKSRDMFSNVYS
jgi:glycerol-3-phosphate O-acyltransferase/dihydroxyacetone phosphate acyltransferase